MITLFYVLSVTGFIGCILHIYLLSLCEVNKAKLFQPEEWHPKLTYGVIFRDIILSVIPITNFFYCCIITYPVMFASIQTGFWKIKRHKWLFMTPQWYTRLINFFNTPVKNG